MAATLSCCACLRLWSQAAAKRRSKRGAPPPPAVTVAKPIKRTVTDHDEYVGRFTAINSVEVRARVSGYLDGVHFKDGQIVKQGDLLFTIDKRPFQNTLDQARANLAQAKSNLAFTESDYTRGQQLVRDKTITDQVFEQRAQAFRNAQASVNNNEAAVRQAELDIEFTELRAPVNGRIGDRRVSPGNLVTGGTAGNTTLLATIVSTDPIYFEFTFDEASFLRYERMAKTGNDVASRNAGVPVALKLIDEQDFVHKGHMDFVDNVIDRVDRHHSRPRGVRQSQQSFHARHVRARAACRLAALRGLAGAGRGHRHRADAQIRSHRRRRQHGRRGNM